MYPTDAGESVVSAVRYALFSTRALIVCPLHCDQIIRVRDDAAESHAVARARNVFAEQAKAISDDELGKQFERQERISQRTILAAP